uniref:DUF1985 domain-containing protein n=1 Tax=Lactuca sativa TaxID=4236 RepID=A0A9R1VH83_LACSA|nr:hypothetical protein LSAT_V11C500259060 [Lactuca sativa]
MLCYYVVFVGGEIVPVIKLKQTEGEASTQTHNLSLANLDNFSIMLLFFVEHDYNNFNVKAIVNLKESECNIWEVFDVLDGARRDIFRDTVFCFLLDVPRLQGDILLFHKMFHHQIRPDVVLSPDGIKQLYFRVGDTKMVYGPEEFCLITGLNFGEYSKNIGKKVSEKIVSSKKKGLLRERLFPNYINSSVKIGDLKSFILNQPFLEVGDADAVRVCLIYILCESFLKKEINDRVPQDWFFFFFFLLRNWISETFLLGHRQTLKYFVSGFTAPFRIWIYEMLPVVHACGFVLRKNKDMPRMKRWSGTKKLKWEGQPLRNKMSSNDDEMTSCYYMSFQEYVYGERKSVPSPVRDHFRRQDESSSSMSSIGRSHGRGVRSGKPSLEEVFMNQEPTEVFVEEVNNEDLWNNICFEEPAIVQTKFDEPVNDEGMNKNNTNENVFGDIEDDKEMKERNENAGCSRNKFDDDVFDVNDYNEAKEIETFFN